MNTRTFELTDEQVDAIVLEELKLAWELNAKPDKIDCSDDYIDPDYALLGAIEKVLEYFMTKGEFDQWKIKRGNNAN